MNLQSTFEGVQIALDSLRSDKVRAFLTILGIGIGVATVTGMGAIMNGVQNGISADLEAIGPANFQVARFDQTQIRISAGGPPWEGKPKLRMTEARMLAELPAVQSVTPAVGGNVTAKVGPKELSGVSVQGLGSEWTSYTLGDFVQGRNYLPADDQAAAPVVVVTEELARRAFGEGKNAVGQLIRLQGSQFRVVGVYRPKPNLFDSGKPIWVSVPSTAALKYLPVYDDFMEFWIVPAPGYTQAQAMDQVTVGMRTFRRLKPRQENNFALVRQEAFADLIGKITGAIKLVMLVLSSIGLMVGGVGVVGIMMISVTERTREIGVRKALGARRGEILWQFMVEAVTVTFIGGLFGLLFGAGGALLLEKLTPIPASVPLSSIAFSLGMAIITGVVFGIYPAAKAARMDPVVALRYE
ncbi:MAG TPA: ABC transporter permease [Longimicrobium sp.]|nr:ABC transporter permease [Longimicrobium sp.]